MILYSALKKCIQHTKLSIIFINCGSPVVVSLWRISGNLEYLEYYQIINLRTQERSCWYYNIIIELIL